MIPPNGPSSVPSPAARRGIYRTARRLWACALAALLVAAFAGARLASAHANLERADPPPGAILETAPRELRLWFSEAIELRFSSVQVLNIRQQRVPAGELRIVNAAETEATVALPELPPGTYTVVWRTLSKVDGHVWQGFYPLTVGLDQMPAATPPTVGETTAPALLGVLGRWLSYLGAALLLGAIAAARLVVAPALRARLRPSSGAATPGLVALCRGGVLMLALGAVLLFWEQARASAGVGQLEALQPGLWIDVLQTRYGAVWLLRLASIAALAVFSGVLRPGEDGPLLAPRAGYVRWLLLAVSGALLLFTTTLNSHAVASAQGGPLAWLADWLHLLATSVWVGGLAATGLTLRFVRRAAGADRSRLSATLLVRFSRLALLSVGVLALTGIYQTWLHVGGFPALRETAYGQVLVIKLVLLVPVLALAAHNYLVARRPASRVPVARLRWTVAAELAVAVIVLGVVGALTSLPPARDAYRLANRGIVERAVADDLHLTLRVEPGAAGSNTFALEARGADGQPARQVQRVTLRFRPLVVDLGESEARLVPAGEGSFRSQGGYLSLPGYWQVEVSVRRSGQEDARSTLRLAVPAEPGGELPGQPAGQSSFPSRRLVVGLELVALGAVSAVLAKRLSRRRVWAGVLALTIALAASLGGVYAVAVALMDSDVAPVNPFSGDAASIERGRVVYAEQCAACHGATGRGDGPLAATLSPPPVDLRQHVMAHTEDQLFRFISRGISGTAMPAFRESMSETDRWHVLNYIRSAFEPATSWGQSPAVAGVGAGSAVPQAGASSSAGATTPVVSAVPRTSPGAEVATTVPTAATGRPALANPGVAAERTTGAPPGCHGLRWLGHATFLLSTAHGTRLLFDPYSPDLGYPPLTLGSVDAVLLSNRQPDSANTAMAPGAHVVNGQALSHVHGVIGDSHLFSGFPAETYFGGPTYRDAARGATFGPNALVLVAADALDGVRFLHLGGLGHVLAPEQVARIRSAPRVDVLMLPVGGYAGLDAAGATEVVRQIAPRLVVPMAYRTALTRADWPGAGVEPFLTGKIIQRAASDTIAVCPGRLPEETLVVVPTLPDAP